MIRFYLFGTVDLRDHTTVASILAQPKRTALVAYLASANHGGWHRRTTLLALFWPELDESRARNALSKALHHIRRSLGEDAILGRGDEELAVNRDRVWCDVAAFEEAFAATDHQTALELYGRGVLLEGFLVSDAPEFEHWLDGRRESLREKAVKSASVLLQSAMSANDLPAAIGWARRAVLLAPHDEPALRRLMTLLDQIGNRADAIGAYEAFAARLQRELELRPSPETEQLLHTIRSRSTPNHESTDVLPRTDATPVSISAARLKTQLPTNNARKQWLSIALLIVLTLSGLVTLAYRRTGENEGRVLVAACENRTGDATLDALGDMAQDWITQGLQQTGLANVVDPLSALLATRAVLTGSTQVSGLTRAAATARAVGAHIVVWCSIYKQGGDSLLLRGQITDVERGRLLTSLEPVRVHRAQATVGAELLRSQAGGALAALLDTRVASLSSSTSSPPNLEAYREYVAGLEHFQEMRYNKSIVHFSAAARLDTTFMLPLIWSAFAFANPVYNSSRVFREQRDSIVHFLQARRDRLKPLDQYATDYFAGDARARADAARAAARLSPGSNWSYLAAMYTNCCGMNRPREALSYLKQVDPEHGWVKAWSGYWSLAATLYHRVGDYKGELRSAQRFRRSNPTRAIGLVYESQALVALGRIKEAERLTDELVAMAAEGNRSPTGLLTGIGKEMRAHGHRDAARRTFEKAVAWAGSPRTVAWIRRRPVEEQPTARRELDFELADALYNLGRWAESEAIWRRIEDTEPGVASQAYLGFFAARRGDRSTAESILRSLERETLYADAAKIAVLLGDRDRALALVKQMIESGDRPFQELHRDPAWDALRDTPEFKELIQPGG